YHRYRSSQRTWLLIQFIPAHKSHPFRNSRKNNLTGSIKEPNLHEFQKRTQEENMKESQKRPRVAVIIGAGDATGGAIARRFAREGYVTVVIRRRLEALAPLVETIQAEGG